MDRAEFLAELAAADVRSGETVYLERRGGDYRWRRGTPPATVAVGPVALGPVALGPGAGSAGDDAPPEAWMVYSGSWPDASGDDRAGFVGDLLAELESMTGGHDRCRWPLDQPYPSRHG